MTVDQVDDVEAAEERLFSMAAALRALLAAAAPAIEEPRPNDGVGRRARRTRYTVAAAAAAAELRVVDREYCRPTCGAHGTPHPDDETCGCPCHVD